MNLCDILPGEAWPFLGISEFSKFFTREFFGIFSGFYGIFKSQSRSPGFRDFRDFSGFLRGFKIPVPIRGILRFSGFSNPDPDPRDFGIFWIFRSRPKLKIPIPNPRGRVSGSRKNPNPKPTLLLRVDCEVFELWKNTNEDLIRKKGSRRAKTMLYNRKTFPVGPVFNAFVKLLIVSLWPCAAFRFGFIFCFKWFLK